MQTKQLVCDALNGYANVSGNPYTKYHHITFLFFFLFGPTVLSGSLHPQRPSSVPIYFSPIRDSCTLNICPNTFSPSRSLSSSCPYTARLTVEYLLGFCSIIHPTDVANPVQSSYSYNSNNVHVFIPRL